MASRSFLKAAAALAVVASMAVPVAAQRVRSELRDGWRFHRGDPPGLATDLRYDVRPEVTESADTRIADTRPEAAASVRSAATVLKPWILPTANPLIRDPARRHLRPAGDPGGDVAFVRPAFDDRGWQPVRLPHDWAIDRPFIKEGAVGGMGRLPSWGIGWYRRTLDVPARDRGRSVFLDLDGAMAYATVWLNGRLVGGWPYGYNGWRVDLTPYLAFGGRNQLAIRLDNPPESSRWYPGGGLYRRVWLTTAAAVHVGQWGSVVTTPAVDAGAATVAVATTLDNDGAAPVQASVATAIYALDAAGRRTGAPVARLAPQRVALPAKASATVAARATVANPRLWGPPPTQAPNRYLAVTEVTVGGRTVDRYETAFGIRALRFDAEQGLSVNGERVRIQGVNLHHDLGALGAAFNRSAAQRQLRILRDMGANAIRMSHNPPDPQLLDLADEMGFLVMDEVFDSWERRKTPLDFHLVFPDWHEPDLRAMLRRDRNHPSIVMWSIGNEVGEQYTGEAGGAIARTLAAIVREEDPTRPTTTAMNFAGPGMPLPEAVDVVSLNYQGTGVRSLPGQFAAFHRRHPDKMILASESASALSTRGAYLFPVAGATSGPVRPGSGGDPATRAVSAYELHAADFGSTPDRDFAAFDQNPFVAGEFVWTGFDYLGEPTPYYASRSSYSGIVDLAGFPKDRFWLYQSRWRPDLRFAHILPHWTWPGREGQVTPVQVFSSADEAELFVNGTSQGRIKRAPFAYRFRWDYVIYQPGEIRVVTWKDGKAWATATTATAAAPARLQAAADRPAIVADGDDLTFVTVRVTDAQGRTAPGATNRIRFVVDGPGELVATDNGDPTSFVPFASPERAAMAGLALAIVRARPGASGTIRVRAESDGLTGATATVRLERQNPRP